MPVNTDAFSRRYSEKSFWGKLARNAGAAGEEIVEKALQLHYVMEKPGLPNWVRASIYGSLGYFIMPFDAMPDVVPGVGYSDDFAILVLAFMTVARHIDDEVRAKAAAKMRKWFGPAVIDS